MIQYIVMIPIGLVLGLVVLFFILSRIPLPTESDLSTKPWFTFYLHYSGKYLFYVKRAALGSGFKKYFSQIKPPSYSGDNLTNKTQIRIKAIGDLMYRPDLREHQGKNLWDHIGRYLFDADICAAKLSKSLRGSASFQSWIVIPSFSFASFNSSVHSPY